MRTAGRSAGKIRESIFTMDYYEIDFLGVSPKSGDAITMRYSINGETYVHVVDAGYQANGDSVVKHIRKHYGNPSFIDHVIATHADGDHCGGLRTILEEFDVGTLWMLCPWHFSDELVHRFARFTNATNLARKLREIYPNLAALEHIANQRGVAIRAPFQGEQIGPFTVLSPTYSHFLDLVESSEKTPEQVAPQQEESLIEAGLKVLAKLVNRVWGEEVFSTEETSAENEMSIVQWANMKGHDIVLTGDAGRQALRSAAAYAPNAGLQLPGVKKMQVPHHGSRRNVDADILNQWLGSKKSSMPSDDEFTASAYVSASKDDNDHPRKSVIRAFMHRGSKVYSTEGLGWLRTYKDAPERENIRIAKPLPYPDDQEED